MKKLLLFIMTLSCFTAYSQFGFRAGITNLQADEFEDADFSVGFYAGMFSRVDLGGIGLRPEINLYQSVAMEKEGDAKASVKRSYIDFGSNFEFFVSDGFSILVGPTFHYILGGSFKVEYDGDDIIDEDMEFDYLDFVERLKLVLNVGFSYNISDNILMDVRYERTLAYGMNDWDFDMEDQGEGHLKAGVGFIF